MKLAYLLPLLPLLVAALPFAPLDARAALLPTRTTNTNTASSLDLDAREPSCSCHEIGNTGEYLCSGTTCGRDLGSASVVVRDVDVEIEKRCKNDAGQPVPCDKARRRSIEARCKNDAGQTVPCDKVKARSVEKKRCTNDSGLCDASRHPTVLDAVWGAGKK